MTNEPLAPLTISAPLIDQLHEHIKAGYPYETCGLFIGEMKDGSWVVKEVIQAQNLNTERANDRFELDPGDFMKADNRARELGLQVMGIWHSHPDHPAKPSVTDIKAAWQGYSYLIAKVTKEGVELMTSWRLIEGELDEYDSHDMKLLQGNYKQFIEEEVKIV